MLTYTLLLLILHLTLLHHHLHFIPSCMYPAAGTSQACGQNTMKTTPQQRRRGIKAR